MTPSSAILIGALLATAGWLYTGRRARTLSRKQHTINVIMQTNLNDKFLEARNEISPIIKSGEIPQDVVDGTNAELRAQFRNILNHYEFVCAGLRNGDFDERLIKDSERSTYVELYGCCKEYIWRLRSSRDRMTIYEHFEWVNSRWTDKPPKLPQRAWEFVWGRPVYGKKS